MLQAIKYGKSYKSLFYRAETGQQTLKAYPSRGFSACRQLSAKLTYYEVLGVEREATAKEIRAAFLKKSKECHPDMNSTDPNNHMRFISVKEAYTTLSRPATRHVYDASLLHRQGKSHGGEWQSYGPGFYGEQIHKARDASRNEGYEKPPYGVKRVSKSTIVAACIAWMLTGAAIHYIVVMLHLKNLDERDIKARQILIDAERRAESYLREKRLQNDAAKTSRG